VAEVEVDPHTGSVRLTRIVAVDDIGTVINPLIAHGQIHGGVAQGVGQALMENVVYDAETGQLLSGSFLDYAMPRADDLPSFGTEFDESLPTLFKQAGSERRRRVRDSRSDSGRGQRGNRRAQGTRLSITWTCR